MQAKRADDEKSLFMELKPAAAVACTYCMLTIKTPVALVEIKDSKIGSLRFVSLMTIIIF